MSQQVYKEGAREASEVSRYNLSLRPRVLVYAIADGYLVQPIPVAEGGLFVPPMYAKDELDIGAKLLDFIAKENLR